MLKWSSVEDEIVLNGIRAQKALEQIAASLGRKPEAVEQRVIAMGMTLPKEQMVIAASV